MKKIVCMLLVAALLMVFVAGCAKTDDSVTLEVYNWGEYISTGTDGSLDVIAEFEKLTGIKVHYTNFANNEEMYTKIKEGGVQYDIVIPSDYMIARMIEEQMLEKLDFSNIPNYVLIGEEYKNLEYDALNQYSVPYMSGIVGLIYNVKKVKTPPTSWSALWDVTLRNDILMFDNPRDAFGIALLKLGYSINTVNPDEIAEAAQALKDQKELVQAYVMDQIFNKMEGNEAAIAPYYAGDAIIMMRENPDLRFVIPEEGTNYFVDAMVIPKGTQHKAEAEMFINFMCQVDISAANANFIGYSTPVIAARDLLELSEQEMAWAYPDEEIMAKTQVFTHLPQTTNELMSRYWSEIKTQQSGVSAWVFLIPLFAVIGGAVVIMVMRARARKRKYY